tara:strand:- start:40 stop:429 length:390 start_codon:yes stop_codon:yes gene_type:complete
MKYKIYKLIDNTNGNIYIGMTTNLRRRLSQHKNKDNDCLSRKIIANGDYRIELIEETDDKTRERYWIENTECINIQIPGRTLKERRATEKFKKTLRTRRMRLRKYEYSWGGDKRSSNNLLLINTNLFLI